MATILGIFHRKADFDAFPTIKVVCVSKPNQSLSTPRKWNLNNMMKYEAVTYLWFWLHIHSWKLSWGPLKVFSGVMLTNVKTLRALVKNIKRFPLTNAESQSWLVVTVLATHPPSPLADDKRNFKVLLAVTSLFMTFLCLNSQKIRMHKASYIEFLLSNMYWYKQPN